MAQTKGESKSKYGPFFSRSMEHPLIAQAFFVQHLPPHLQQSTDLDTFIRFDRTNTNAQLAKRHRDIAYQAQMSGNTILIACVEQQSKPDVTMLARFLYYSAANIDACLKENQKLPLIIQFLFYKGAQAPYPYPTTLQNHYSHPEWAVQELSLRFHLIDATQISDAELLTHGHCAPMELLLKHGRDGTFELAPDTYREVFQQCVAALGDDHLHTMLTYAAELSNGVAGENIFSFIEEVLTDKTDIIMTYAQKLVHSGELMGEKKGLLMGEQKGKVTIAKTMLKAGESKEKIMKFTGLTLRQIEQLA